MGDLYEETKIRSNLFLIQVNTRFSWRSLLVTRRILTPFQRSDEIDQGVFGF